MNIVVMLPGYEKVLKTHNFNFDEPIKIHTFEENPDSYFTDYKCKNCGILLVETGNGQYYIVPDISDYSDDYKDITCDEFLMEGILK